VFAILDEQGLGKSFEVLATAERLYCLSQITGLLIVAPNGVHSNWTRQEVPKHLNIPYVPLEWSSSKRLTKKFQNDVSVLFNENKEKLKIISFNVEAFSTPGPATELAKKFLVKFPSLMVIDESSRIKTPTAQRTKRIITLGRQAKYKRVLTGTPVTQSPFDLYSQFLFLDPQILGFSSFFSFKHHYGRWDKNVATQNGRTWTYETLMHYVRLDDLKSRIRPYSIRRTKAECLDLPEKIYKTITFEMSPAQRHLYTRLMDEGIIEFTDFESLNPLQITRLLRAQQIIGGYLPTANEPDGADPKWSPIPGPNPKLDLLMDLIEDYPSKMVIWARFKAEITEIVFKLWDKFGRKSVVELHGGVPKSERQTNLIDFQNSSAVRFLVGQQQSGIGIDLFAAETMVFYSNTFSYENRYQCEDRAHRIGLRHPVVYIDLVAEETVDEKIVEVLKRTTKMAYKMLDQERFNGRKGKEGG
jgi:SNF2 family DNA or RNA helicase